MSLFKREFSNNAGEEKVPTTQPEMRWLVTSLALMEFTKNYNSFYRSKNISGHWDDLPFDSANQKKTQAAPKSSVANKSTRVSDHRILYSPNQRSFVAPGKRKASDVVLTSNARNDVDSVSSSSNLSEASKADQNGYHFSLNQPINKNISLDEKTLSASESKASAKANSASINDTENSVALEDNEQHRSLFAVSLADNVAGKSNESPNHSIVEKTILNQISTNHVLSAEYQHFLRANNDIVQSSVTDTSVVSSASNVANDTAQAGAESKPSSNVINFSEIKKSAHDNQVSGEARASSASSTLNSVQNNYDLSSDNSLLNENESSEESSVQEQSAVENSVAVEKSSEAENDSSVEDAAVSLATTYFESAKNDYSDAGDVDEFATSVANYVSENKKHFDSISKSVSDTIAKTNNYIDTIDDYGEKLSSDFDSLSNNDQNVINDINQNVQNVSTENADIEDALEAVKQQLPHTISSLNSHIEGAHNAFNDVQRFFSAVDISFDNKDGNAAKMYANYVSSATSVAQTKSDAISSGLDEFNSTLAQNSSYADKTNHNMNEVKSNASDNAKIYNDFQAQKNQQPIENSQDAQPTSIVSASDFNQSNVSVETSNVVESSNEPQFSQPSAGNVSQSSNDVVDSLQGMENSTNVIPDTQTLEQKIGKITADYNNATQLISKMNVARQQLEENKQHLQQLFDSLKTEFANTKQKAAQGQTTSLISMAISKMDALMNDATQIISRIQSVNQNIDMNQKNSNETLSKIQQYLNQMNEVVRLSKTFDPLTSESVDSMAAATLNRTNGYYQQINQMNNELANNSNTIQSQINTMDSYYNVAAKNASLMDSINQISSITDDVKGASDDVETLYNNANASLSSLDAYRNLADSLTVRMNSMKAYTDQQQATINEYASMMPNNETLRQLGQQAFSAASRLHSAQLEMHSRANEIDFTYSRANASMANLNQIRSDVKSTEMTTDHYASQAVICFNTNDNDDVKNNISEMKKNQEQLSMMCSAASNAVDDVKKTVSQFKMDNTFNKVEIAINEVKIQLDGQVNKAKGVQGGIGDAMNRANAVAAEVSRLFDVANQKTMKNDSSVNTLDINVQRVNANLAAINNSSNIAQQYTQQVLNKISDVNDANYQQATNLAQQVNQLSMGTSGIQNQVQGISSQFNDRRNVMSNTVTNISSQADSANQVIQRAFNELRDGNLNSANSLLDEAENDINLTKQTLSNYENDLTWIQTSIETTNNLIHQTENSNSEISRLVNSAQQITNQIGR